MATIPSTQISSYLEHLPAIFQQDADQESVMFIGRFLLAFEKILTGLKDIEAPGLEEVLEGLVDADGNELAGIHRYFAPGPDVPEAQRAPEEFLEWIASWMALSLREDWEEEEKRRFISRIVPLYRERGTKAGLEKMLRTYTGIPGKESVQVSEFVKPLQIDKTCTIGLNTVIGGGPPHFFLVKLILPTADPILKERKELIARAIIDQEKPAHTYYTLVIETPTMQIGERSTIGVNTLLGPPPDESASEQV